MDIQHLEKTLWQAADKLRNNMDAAEYKHIVLGLIFLKYVSDSFDEQYKKAGVEGFDSEDRDFYLADNVFWVPKEARWEKLQNNAKQPNIGILVDEAMDSIERDNNTLKGVLPKNYAREALDKRRLGELIDTFTNIRLIEDEHSSRDVLGGIYEYFMGMFANAEGKRGGEFYTPRSVVKLLVEMIEPYRGRVYDPCCGSGGMFVQSEKFIDEHKGKIGDIAIYGQESNQTTWKLAKMNMAIRGIDADIKYGDTLANDKLKDLRSDYILANPPFNDSDWGGNRLKNDIRWKYGAPPEGNANFAWIQHFVHHLAPGGIAGFVLADTTLSAGSTEGEIRKKIIEDNLVDCIISLPGQLFTNTGIPACLWFLRRGRASTDETLFINAQSLGNSKGRRKREFKDKSISLVAGTYHQWREWREKSTSYEDGKGFCCSVGVDQIAANGYNLAPSRYISSDEVTIAINRDTDDSGVYDQFDELANVNKRLLSNIVSSWVSGYKNIKLQDVVAAQDSLSTMATFSRHIFEDLITKQFDSTQKASTPPSGWKRVRFGDLFSERKQRVKDLETCPELFSVTNMGIQSRSEKYSKDLSKSVDNNKVAHKGDIVFGLSREIPNVDVMFQPIGAFSSAYSVYAPHDDRIGLIIGTIMRLRLMEQTDLLKGGAREGRGLDKDKLNDKTFIVPDSKTLDMIWNSNNK